MEYSEITVLFFDGNCNLCNRSVQFFLKSDSQQKLFFSPLTGELAGKFLSANARLSDTVVLLHKNKEHLRSSAIIRSLILLGFPWNISAVLLLIPGFIRDLFYRLVAKNRLRWFGRAHTCWIMQEKWKSRFV